MDAVDDMLRPMKAALLMLLGAFTLLAKGGNAQDAPARRIDGRVIDTLGNAIAWASIRVEPSVRTISDDSGHFAFAADARRAFELEVRRIGFRAVALRLPPGGDTTLAIRLVPVAQPLEEATIKAEQVLRSLERRGFYSRLRDREKGINTGYFITPEDLERRKPLLTTRALEETPGVRVQRVPYMQCRSIHRCYMIAGVNGCPFTVYLDGARITSMSGNDGRMRGDFLDELVMPTSIAGMEVYTRLTNAPPGFNMLNGTCGVLLIWSR